MIQSKFKKQSTILFDRQALDGKLVGGKFAKQAVMAANGLPIPRFFCFTAHAYRLATSSIARDIAQCIDAIIDFRDQAHLLAESRKIEKLFLDMVLPETFDSECNRAFDSLFSADQTVAVRASIIGNLAEESEDSDANPFAGISRSFLFIQRDQVLSAVRRCFASGYSPEAIRYRHEHGFDQMGFAVSVGVQAMAKGDRSFVLFTCHPQTLSHDPVVIAGFGVGEGVVQESVPVDHFFIDSASGKVERRLSHKDEMLAPSLSGNGLCRRSVSDRLCDLPCLDEGELVHLVELGRRIELLFGAPQDIEGVLSEGGEVQIVQARPIAVAHERFRLWSNANVSESFPGTTTALTYGFARQFYRLLVYDYLRRIGVATRNLHRIDETLRRMVGYIEGRIYHCVSSFYRVNSFNPLFEHFRGEFDKDVAELNSRYFSTKLQTRKPWWSRMGRTIAFWRAAIIAILNFATLNRRFARFQRWWESVMKSRRGVSFSRQHALVLLDDYQKVWREVGDWWGVTLINYENMLFFNSLANQLFQRWNLDKDSSLLSDLLCGDEQLMGVEIVLSVVRLADMVRKDNVLTDRFVEGDPRDLWDDLESGRLPERFSRAVYTHIDQYGDRGLQELKMEQPNLRDTPWVLMGMIQTYAGKEITAQLLNDHERKIRREGEKRLAKAFRAHPLRLLLVRWVVGKVRKNLRLREHGRYFRSELFGYSKKIFRAMGEQFVERGVLDLADDIYHLQPEEIFGFIDGSGVDQDLRALAKLRRRQFLAFKERHPRKEFTSADFVSTSIPQNGVTLTDNENCLRGIGSSAGRVRGRARVLLTPSLDVQLADDEILIARETDPGWLFLMLAAKGIVVERGSMLSHTAITGRKFGIPTVVGVPKATTAIPDGQEIEIDGAEGTVILVPTPEEDGEDTVKRCKGGRTSESAQPSQL